MTRNEYLDQKILNCSRLLMEAIREIEGYKEFTTITALLKQAVEPTQAMADKFGKLTDPVLRKKVYKQFCDLKAKHPDAILLFHDEEDYFIYKEDAAKAAATLGLELKKEGFLVDDEGKPVAETSFHQSLLGTNQARLLRAGHCVAICERLS